MEETGQADYTHEACIDAVSGQIGRKRYRELAK